MTDEEIRIAIAGVCGLKFVRAGHIEMPGAQEVWPDHWQDTRGKRKRIDGSIVGIPVVLPNYPKPLDAMHEAVGHLTYDQRMLYQGRLASVVGAGDARTDWWEADFYFDKVLNATARQSAEAFLRTLNLWKD